jgi:hypothetical protein
MKTPHEIAMLALAEFASEHTGIRRMHIDDCLVKTEEGGRRENWQTFAMCMSNDQEDFQVNAEILVSLRPSTNSCAVAICLKGYRAPHAKGWLYPNQWDHRHIGI